MRVLFTGSRTWTYRLPILTALRNLDAETDIIIHGGARGADHIAADLAIKRGFKIEAYPANWDTYGRSAGPVRNKRMLSTGIDRVYAFPLGDSRGTRHMIRIAQAAGVEVIIYGEESV